MRTATVNLILQVGERGIQRGGGVLVEIEVDARLECGSIFAAHGLNTGIYLGKREQKKRRESFNTCRSTARRTTGLLVSLRRNSRKPGNFCQRIK